ncbi:MAG: GNAT family N-acetyltransferase [Candidatus Thorarchaeota archaeon]
MIQNIKSENWQALHPFEEKAGCYQNLERELSRAYSAPIKVVCPCEWNQTSFSWFETIEQNTFRQELRYTYSETLDRWNKQRRLIVFILIDHVPEAMIIGYDSEEPSKQIFILDTIAVTTQHKGIGKILMNFLIQWAREEQFQAIVLDTEENNERGFPLVNFYKKFGFEPFEKDNNGNVRLIRSL